MQGFSNFVNTGEIAPTTKMWRMEKPDIMKYWQTLNPNSPIAIQPIKNEKKGSNYGEDGIRITGNRTFIDSVLGRIKDLMAYESPTTSLNVVYRQTTRQGTTAIPENKETYAFYLQVKQKKQKVPNPGNNAASSSF